MKLTKINFMKKIFFLFVVIFFLCKPSYSQAPDWLWAKSARGIGFDIAYSIALDASGNTYVAGWFYGTTLNFGNITLINSDSTNSNADIFLAKYDANGNVLWAKSAEGMYDDFAYSIAVDTSGNTYVTGSFNSPYLTFGSTTLTNAGGDDIFLVKYDANGNVLWAKSPGGAASDDATSVAVDVSGNIYLAGYFFSPTITFDSITLTNVGSQNIFIAKYDTNGNVIWAKCAGGTDNDDAFSIAVDVSGNIYMTGGFTSPIISFGSTTLTNTNSYIDIFLSKYDANGNVLWAKSFWGTGDDYATSLSSDAFGNIYMAGYFYSSLGFGSTILTNVDNTYNATDLFIAKFDANGNSQWAKSAGGMNNDYASSISVDALGNTYVAGCFYSDTIIFSPITLTNEGYQNIFISKYEANGNVLWAISAGGKKCDEANSIAVDASGNIYALGIFSSPTINFDSTILTNVDSTGYYPDIFLAKLCSSTGITEINSENTINIFPNPAIDNLTIETPQKSEIEILNIEGQIIKSISVNNNHTSIDISSFARGMYFVKVKTENGVEVKKFVKE